MEDNQIIELFFQRDETALTHTRERYGSRLQALAFRILGNREDAEECENDTYWRAWNSIPPQRPDPLLTYLCKIARNAALSRRRASLAQKRNSSFDVALEELEACLAAPDSPEGELEARDLAAAINGFLAELPYEDRYVFLRRYWYGDELSRIADQMGGQSHRLSVRLSRTRKKLKNYLEKEGLL